MEIRSHIWNKLKNLLHKLQYMFFVNLKGLKEMCIS